LPDMYHKHLSQLLMQKLQLLKAGQQVHSFGGIHRYPFLDQMLSFIPLWCEVKLQVCSGRGIFQIPIFGSGVLSFILLRLWKNYAHYSSPQTNFYELQLGHRSAP
jgi:hypothetical protein